MNIPLTLSLYIPLETCVVSSLSTCRDRTFLFRDVYKRQTSVPFFNSSFNQNDVWALEDKLGKFDCTKKDFSSRFQYKYVRKPHEKSCYQSNCLAHIAEDFEKQNQRDCCEYVSNYSLLIWVLSSLCD